MPPPTLSANGLLARQGYHQDTYVAIPTVGSSVVSSRTRTCVAMSSQSHMATTPPFEVVHVHVMWEGTHVRMLSIVHGRWRRRFPGPQQQARGTVLGIGEGVVVGTATAMATAVAASVVASVVAGSAAAHCSRASGSAHNKKVKDNNL